MAETSYPSPNHNSRNVTDGEYETISAFNGDGVHALPSDGAVVVAGTGMQVLVKAGTVATVRGHAWEAGPTDVALTVSANSSGSTRYDVVVLRLDRSTWDVTAQIVEGTPGSGYPSLSADTGDTGAYDVSLALLTVPSGASVPTVSRATRYAPSGITPANSGEVPFLNRTGDIHYRPDTGAIELWNGSKWVGMYYDSGELSLGAGYDTWEDYVASKGRRIGDVVTLRVAKRRIGSTFNASDENGSKLCTLPAAFVPKSNQYFGANVSGFKGSVTVEVRPDGEVWAIQNQQDITVGRVIAITCTYVLF